MLFMPFMVSLLFVLCARRMWGQWLPVGPVVAVVVSLVVMLESTPAMGQFDLDVEQKMLFDLLRDGKYKQALSEAKRIEKIVRPSKKNAVVGPATKTYVDLLIYQGTIERRMGNLDAADKMLTEAFKLVSDPVYKQFLAYATPEDKDQQLAYFLAVELPSLQLIDNGTEVLLERIHAANQRLQLQATSPAPLKPASDTANDTRIQGEGEQDDAVSNHRDQIVTWFRRVDDLIRMSQSARATLRGKFADAVKEGNSPEEARFADSPQARVMASLARPYRHVGMRYLEASRLPWTLSFDTDTPPDEAPARKNTKASASEPASEDPEERLQQAASQRRRATAYLQRSVSIAEEAMAPVLQAVARDETAHDATQDHTIPADIRQAARQEAARIRTELAVPLTELELFDGDLEAARSRIDSVLSALREAEPPNHPELARPLIISAEVSFAESRQSLADNDPVAARDQARSAVEALQEAKRLLTSKDSAFDPEAPLHAVLASQLAVAESFAKSSSQTAATTSAADAAARRALAAIRAAPKPKPVTPAATPDPKAAKPVAPSAPAPGGKR
jgi:tetratricopeptide (TPR) repeat protein